MTLEKQRCNKKVERKTRILSLILAFLTFLKVFLYPVREICVLKERPLLTLLFL